MFYDDTKKKEELINKLENNIDLLGVIAIEDALQENVKETLEVFINTGMKVWMLTGDQKLTAESIARSCNLITEQYNVNVLSEDLEDNKIEEQLDKALIIYDKKFNNKNCLVIGTVCMNTILNNKDLTRKVT